MRKTFFIAMTTVMMCASITACSGNKTSTKEATTAQVEATTSTQENSTAAKTVEKEFKQATQEELAQLPEAQRLGEAIGTACLVAGITGIDGNTQFSFGNFSNNSSNGIDVFSITCRATAANGKTLDFLCSYVKTPNVYGKNDNKNHWKIASIENVENGHKYYVFEESDVKYDIYDFQTEQLKEDPAATTTEAPTTESSTAQTEATTEAKAEEESFLSYKAVKKADRFPYSVTYTRNMSNDVTGNWRLSEIAENIDIEDHAISYYKTYFADPSEVHIVINYTRNTTTCITAYGNLLFVDLYDLVPEKDKDAKASLAGTPLASYQIDLKTGKKKKIE